ncbi:MAG TPA: molybdopterin-synthase adenylyltransferase MoeB [Burkholderiales bacterium]|nr:molybdopterin-synthase adenylyltransferase MoeB [Burkholderiales bacterium]
MEDAQLLRYSRHILLPEIDIEGQTRLLKAKVLLIGVGGLGSPIALYLTASGIGTLTICDSDIVDLTNLQRQIVHTTDSIGISKVLSAKKTLERINPEIRIIALNEKLQGKLLIKEVSKADVVIDASDNFSTRYALNRACVQYKVPLVSGSAIRFDGQVTVFNHRQSEDSPCYNCLFPEEAQSDELRCSETGIFSPLVGIIGATEAAEAIKIITHAGNSLIGRLLLLNALSMEWKTIKLKKDPGCSICNSRP